MHLLIGHEAKKASVVVNGLDVPAILTIQWDFDDFPAIEDHFDLDSTEENEAYLKRFETGELLSVVVSAVVRAEGLEGIDTLGQCHVRSTHFEDDVLRHIQDYDMVETAKEELRREILDAAVRLQKYA